MSIKEENDNKGISRRTLLKSMVASGVVFAVSSGASKMAKADSYSQFWAADIPKEKLIWMYQTMLKARFFDVGYMTRLALGDEMFEERAPQVHSTAGQEAISVGVIAHMTKDDWCYRPHRNTCHNIARGLDLGKMIATCIYKATGYTQGRGGHTHTASFALKQADHAGLIGMEPLIASGTAYGMKVLNERNKTNNITVRFSGDGDYNCPDTLIALNEAANFKLPIVFVVENNGYQIWVRQDETMAVKDIADRGRGFGIPSRVVDGQDVFAIYNAAKEAVERARSGGGPSLIECKTYRYFDHMNSRGFDPERGLGAYDLYYRSDMELRHWLGKDPINLLRNTLITNEVITDKEADEMKENMKAEVEKAFEWAWAQPNPKSEDGVKFAYADGLVTTELPRQLADCPLY